MGLSKKAYKGCRDFYPESKRKLEYIFSTVKKVCESYAYEPYDGPLLESIDLYYAKSGQELVNEQLYNFTDRGNREVAIRPEMTPTLARMVAGIHRETPKPIRWYSIPNLMRYEKPQRGRLREHWQLNCDIFGAPEAFGEFEILQLLINILKAFGAKKDQFQVLVNDRRLVDALFQDVLKLDDDQSYKLYKIIDKSKKVPEEALDKMLGEVFNTDQIVIIKDYLALNSWQAVFDFASTHGFDENLTALKKLHSQLEDIQIADYITYDPAIVRGLDYYTGIVFEAFDLHPDNRRAICGGGGYANLLQIFDEPALPGIGFGLGDVTLTDFLETHGLLPDFSHAPTDMLLSFQSDDVFDFALKTNHKLREIEGLKLEFHPIGVKPKKAFQLAEKKGIKHVVLIGSQEKEQNQISYKNLKTKETREISFDDITNLNLEDE